MKYMLAIYSYSQGKKDLNLQINNPKKKKN